MQNHPKPDLKLILRPKEDFRDIFQPGQPGWPGPCNQPLNRLFSHKRFHPEASDKIKIAIKYLYWKLWMLSCRV